ncbi:hypothetical protein CAL7716_085020 [Calothrix sp. PCC 7716]|nr:hypothetical protein CAL7716_085020 [Calothrix sp. PCC 7716]
MNPEELLRNRLAKERFSRTQRAIKNQKLLDTAPRAAQYQGFNLNNGAIIRSVGDGARFANPVSNGLVAPGDGVRLVRGAGDWKPRVEFPVEEEVVEEVYYPFKVLFSVKEPDPNDKTKEVLAFYLGGDRQVPKRLFDISPVPIQLFNTFLHNYGNNFKVSVTYSKGAGSYVIVNCSEKGVSVFDGNEYEYILNFGAYYIGDSKLKSFAVFASPVTQSQLTGAYCNTITTETYSLNNVYPSYPFSVNGQDIKLVIGEPEQNEYCIRFKTIRNFNLLQTHINWFVNGLSKPFVINKLSHSQKLVETVDYAPRGEYRPLIVNYQVDYTYQGKYGNFTPYYEAFFRLNHKLSTVSTDIDYNREFNHKHECTIEKNNILFFGKDSFFAEEIDIAGKVYNTKNQESTYAGERTKSTTKFLLNFYNNKRKIEIKQIFSSLILESDVDINLKIDSKNVTFIKNNISIGSYYDVDFSFMIQSELEEFINSYIGKTALVAYHKEKQYYIAECIIEGVNFSVKEERDNVSQITFYALTGSFTVNASILKIKLENFLSFSSTKGRLVINGQCLFNLLKFCCGGATSNAYFYKKEKPIVVYQGMLDLFMLESTRIDAREVFCDDGYNYAYFGYYPPNDLNIYINNIFEFVKTIINLLNNKIYFVQINKTALNTKTSFDDIKTKSLTKYAEGIFVDNQGYAFFEKVESGLCLSLNSPNCTIHAVSYCPTPSP